MESPCLSKGSALFFRNPQRRNTPRTPIKVLKIFRLKRIQWKGLSDTLKPTGIKKKINSSKFLCSSHSLSTNNRRLSTSPLEKDRSSATALFYRRAKAGTYEVCHHRGSQGPPSPFQALALHRARPHPRSEAAERPGPLTGAAFSPAAPRPGARRRVPSWRRSLPAAASPGRPGRVRGSSPPVRFGQSDRDCRWPRRLARAARCAGRAGPPRTLPGPRSRARGSRSRRAVIARASASTARRSRWAFNGGGGEEHGRCSRVAPGRQPQPGAVPPARPGGAPRPQLSLTCPAALSAAAASSSAGAGAAARRHATARAGRPRRAPGSCQRRPARRRPLPPPPRCRGGCPPRLRCPPPAPGRAGPPFPQPAAGRGREGREEGGRCCPRHTRSPGRPRPLRSASFTAAVAGARREAPGPTAGTESRFPHSRARAFNFQRLGRWPTVSWRYNTNT